MTRRAYVYFALTFVLGIVVGGGGLFFYQVRTGFWHPPFNRQRAVKALTHDLTLSPSQIGQLEQILEETGRQHRALENQMDRQFDTLREQSRNRIRQILNPQQVAKFDAIVRQRDEQRRRMRRP